MSRIYLLRSFFLLWFVAVLGRLYYWQVIQAEELTEVARRQYERPVVKDTQRGEIFFADGSPLALNTTRYTLVGKPYLLTASATSVAKQIVAALIVESASPSGKFKTFQEQSDFFTQRLSDPTKKWVPLLSGLTEKEKVAVSALGNDALTFQADSVREYPESSLSAHLLGFVGKNSNGEPQGYFGIEGKYDLELQAKSIRTILETDAVGHPIGMNAVHVEDGGNGRNLLLTIRRDIQYLVEQHLKAGIEKYGAKAGDVIVMNPMTGEVLASSSFPSYDPSQYSIFDQALYKNPVVADAYEPGSTFKVLTVAAGIDAGVIAPDTQCDACAGPVTIGKYTIKTWDNKYHANTTIQEGLTHSDNTAMVYVGRKIGKDAFLRYIKNFGIGSKTGIDLQDESSPKLREDKDWSEIDAATATFGQGIALTPIQMLNGVNAIANGGKLPRPFVVKKVYSDSEDFLVKPEMIRQVIKPETAKVVTDMMQAAASTGDARWTLPKTYPIAGKTGTAQIPVSGHYDEARTIASFVGFAPADAPQFSMLVRLVEPSTSQWGSETAAPLWFAIAKDLFVKYGITPNKN